MKVFISMPVVGETDEEIRGDWANAVMDVEKTLLDMGIVPVNEAIEPLQKIDDTCPPDGVNAEAWAIGKLITLLSEADVVFLMPGWETSRRCRIEQAVAAECGIKMIYG